MSCSVCADFEERLARLEEILIEQKPRRLFEFMSKFTVEFSDGTTWLYEGTSLYDVVKQAGLDWLKENKEYPDTCTIWTKTYSHKYRFYKDFKGLEVECIDE